MFTEHVIGDKTLRLEATKLQILLQNERGLYEFCMNEEGHVRRCQNGKYICMYLMPNKYCTL